ncbi:MAG TPA: FtsX-like permease family protein, partial [Bacteroidales bacterium]|nr:FtsX-like permease family protein [Bacteroidales bacterium]
IREKLPNIFEWLELQNINEKVILALMLIVSIINMVTALLILILERTNMIGILKALGATDWRVRKIFLYNALYLIGKGLLWGDILGLGLCLVQKHFGLIRLPQESYYVSVVPINLDPVHIVLLNLGTLIICSLMLIVPSYIIARIMPAKAIRFN